MTDGYAPSEKRPPLLAYSVLMAIFNGLFAAAVTSPVRAPFTELEGSGGPGELEERARGKGVRLAIGELLVCPYCIALWVVAGFSVGLLLAPRLTRFVASVFSALTLSDFLQIAYKAAEDKGLGE
ncbi:MAG TPA: DUF1360 domain-containing protein [Solirubrobacterales bacterium]|jgi:hypothetical protein|nr:DUF1360 domain-containing protein [Solirubrobacterales bacterium]